MSQMEPVTVTVDDVLSRSPCYPESRMRELYAARERWTALQIIEEIGPQFSIPPRDLLWTVLHEQFLPARTLHLLACRWAAQALETAGSPDQRSVQAIETKLAWLDGRASDEQLAAARDAAAEAEAAAEAAAAAAQLSDVVAVLKGDESVLDVRPMIDRLRGGVK